MVTIGNDRLRSLAEGWAHTAATLVSDCSLAGSQYSENCTDTAVAMEELVRLRAENEQLKADHRKRVDGLEAECQRWQDRLNAAEAELTALPRPVEQSAEVEAIRKTKGNRFSHHPWPDGRLNEACDAIDTLLSALDAAQRDLRKLGQANQNLSNRCATLGEEIGCAGITADKLQAEIARLSSPPEERADIAERQTAYREQLIASDSLSSVSAEAAVRDIDTLLQDLARARNARHVYQAERDQLKAAKLQHDTQQRATALENADLLRRFLQTIAENQRLARDYETARQAHDERKLELDSALKRYGSLEKISNQNAELALERFERIELLEMQQQAMTDCIVDQDSSMSFEQRAEELIVTEVNHQNALLRIERLQGALQKVMARLADLLDEDHFNNIEAVVINAGVPYPPLANLTLPAGSGSGDGVAGD